MSLASQCALLCVQVLSSACGVVLSGDLQDPKVADWLLDPGAAEKNIHRMVTNSLPLEGHLLEGKNSTFNTVLLLVNCNIENKIQSFQMLLYKCVSSCKDRFSHWISL